MEYDGISVAEIFKSEKVQAKNRTMAMPELYVLCLCCELRFGCLTVFSLNILYSFSAEAELRCVNTDVDLLSIADVLTSCPLPPETSGPVANLERVEESPLPSFKPAQIKPTTKQSLRKIIL